MTRNKQSREYKQLEKRLRDLKKYFFPKNFSKIGVYKNKIHDNMRGFRLLFHAELEYYFEELSKRVAKNSIEIWESCGRINKTLLSMSLYSGLPINIPPSFSPKDEEAKNNLLIAKRLKKIMESYYTIISKNNGIKEKDLIKILLPIGISTLSTRHRAKRMSGTA